MTKVDALFGYRLQVFALAAQLGRRGLQDLRDPPLDLLPLEAPARAPRARDAAPARAPRTADAERAAEAGRAADPLVRDRPPGLGPQRVASELARPKWGGIVVSKNGVWRCLVRHGLSTRTKRLALVAGYGASYEPPREPAEERHVQADHPGELVGFDCFFVGRPRGTRHPAWQLRDRRRLLLRLGRARDLPLGAPDGGADLEARPARGLRALRSRLAPRARALPTTAVSSSRDSSPPSSSAWALGAPTSTPAGRRPTANVEALQRTILDPSWRPAFARYLYVRFTGLRRELETYLRFYHFDRAHHGRLTRGRIPADVVHGARKMEAR